MFYTLLNVQCVNLIKRMQVQMDMRSLPSVKPKQVANTWPCFVSLPLKIMSKLNRQH